MARLPLELYHKFFSYLSDDHEALKACSLTCQALTPESQKYIFARIVLGLPSSQDDPRFLLPRFERFQHLCGMPGVGSATKFRQLLDKSPHIAGYVECLQIIEMESLDPKDHKTWISENYDLPHCLPHFQKLKALVVCGFRDWNWLPFGSELVRLLNLPLIFLDLAGCLLPIPIVASMSPDIKHLSIRSYTHKKYQLPVLPNTSKSCPIRLESLFISDVGCLRRQEFSSRLDTTRLRKLALNRAWITCSDRNPEIWNLLETCRNTLEDFMIFSCKDDIWQHGSCAIGQYKEPIDLSRLIALRNITLCIKLGKKDEPDFYINHFWWVNKLLRACSSHNERLQKITVEVAYDYWIRPIDISHWEEIVDALLGHHFTRLKQLDVLIVPPTKADDAKEVIVALQTSGYIERLRSRRPEGLEVNLRDMTLLRAPCIFCPNPSWLCVADAGEWF